MEELVDESYLVEYILREMDDLVLVFEDGDVMDVDGQFDMIMVGQSIYFLEFGCQVD